MSAKDALLKYHARQIKSNNSRAKKKRNKKPEKEAVKEMLSWLRGYGFSVNEIEAKAVYNPKAGRYVSGQVSAGYPDISGNDKHGCAVYVEAKAKGKRSTVSELQVEFLKEKIKTNCFAVVSDSADFLATAYKFWVGIDDYSNKRKYLMSLLPKKDK